MRARPTPQDIDHTTADGAAALPYGGSHRQATVLGYSLMINAGVGFTIAGSEGEEPPPFHWEWLEELREPDLLPAVHYSNDPMPEHLWSWVSASSAAPSDSTARCTRPSPDTPPSSRR